MNMQQACKILLKNYQPLGEKFQQTSGEDKNFLTHTVYSGLRLRLSDLLLSLTSSKRELPQQ